MKGWAGGKQNNQAPDFCKRHVLTIAITSVDPICARVTDECNPRRPTNWATKPISVNTMTLYIEDLQQVES
ncbi:hypothetical protein AFCA_000886 [Aspergillus flavus]|nr:hypothetical protein AFCA_000886 [Aspergillus flavus]